MITLYVIQHFNDCIVLFIYISICMFDVLKKIYVSTNLKQNLSCFYKLTNTEGVMN